CTRALVSTNALYRVYSRSGRDRAGGERRGGSDWLCGGEPFGHRKNRHAASGGGGGGGGRRRARGGGGAHRPGAAAPVCRSAARRYGGEGPAAMDRGWLLSSIGVDPSRRSSGTGQALARAFCARAAKENAKFVYLLTDAADNARAQSFYERSGFHLHSTLERG